MLRQIFSAYISLKEAILERLKTSNKNKVEYGLFIPIPSIYLQTKQRMYGNVLSLTNIQICYCIKTQLKNIRIKITCSYFK